MSAIRSFAPWYRRGLAGGITEETPRVNGRVQVPLNVAIAGRAGTAAVPVQLFGPGDVVGLDRREVLRMHPFDGSTSMDPSLFAHVELASADLPWRFSPAAPDDRGRLVPWLALVVADAENAELAGSPDALAVLRCPGSELPDPADAWAWAHVQVTRTGRDDLETILRDTPARALARLLCPRQLESQRAYLACVVPTFESGRLAGLGRAPDASEPLAPAWRGGADAELPVYHHWRFTTARPGNFETLVRALRPRRLAGTATTRPLALDDPGWGMPELDADDPRATIPMQGLLRAIGAGDLPPLDLPELRDALQASIEQPDERPRIRPPLYGQDYADRRDLPGPDAPPGWLRDLNLDPRHRLAAGLGAMVVRLLQEDLVAEAWRQLARVHRPVEEETARQFAQAVGGTLGAVPASDAASTLERLTRPAGPLARGQVLLGGDPGPRSGQGRIARPRPAAPPARAGVPRSGFAPSYDHPAFDLLTTVHPEWVLPGLDELPTDSVAAVEVNPAFAEAFLLGLNHELARELLWRRYPVDRAGTFFARFWPALPGAAPEAVPEIRSWTTGPLGGHFSQAGSLVLLVRGELLRRFPQTQVYAVRGDAMDPGAEPILPSFGGQLGDDVTLVGFPLDPDEAFADGELWFVVEEAAARARFGCDEAGATPPSRPAAWQDLQWGNADFAARSHLPAEGPLVGLTLPISRTPGSPPESATWGKDAAQMAAITQQPPLRALLPARRWRPPEREPER